MMPVKVFCRNPDCDASYSVSGEMVGRKVRCKKCGTTFVAEAECPTLEPDPEPLGLPSPFGKFRPIRKLGEGGMGAVYLAHDDILDRPVALKVPLADKDKGANAEILDRFQREAKAAASLRHPNFCPVYEAGVIGDRPYLAMAYIEGGTMASLVSRDRPMDPIAAARLIRKVAQAMAVAHDLKMVHRDLKPSNVMIDGAGEPVVMDFGLVRREGAGDRDLTMTNAPFGTVQYMSPEQARGEKGAIGPPTDIYSLGVMLFELLTGDRPYSGTYPVVFAALLSDAPPPSASSIRHGLDPRLEAICARAMNKEVTRRYPSMREFARALEGLLEAEGRDAPPPPIPHIDPPQRPAPPRRNRVALGLAGGLAAVLLGIIIYVATDNGTLKIEGFDPGMVVKVDGREVTISTEGEPTTTVRTGPHGLHITRGDVSVQAPETFEVRRGEVAVVRITREPAPAPSDGLEVDDVRQQSDADVPEFAKNDDAADAKSKLEVAEKVQMPTPKTTKKKMESIARLPGQFCERNTTRRRNPW